MNALTRKDSAGWFIVSDDDFRDDLAGPFRSERDMCAAAAEMGLETDIRPVFVHQLELGTRFRVYKEWYTLHRLTSGCAILSCGGAISLNTEVDEIKR